MSIHRVHKTKDYTVIANAIFKDKRLSLKAKGLHASMMSLPDDWNFSTEGLTALATDKRTSVQSALQELEECGYLIRSQAKSSDGTFNGYIYDVYEVPMIDLPSTENPQQLNTKESSTKSINKKKYIKKKFEPPTREEVRDYISEKGLLIDADEFYDYYDVGDWKDARGNGVKNWKQKAITWSNREKKNGTANTRDTEDFDTTYTDIIFGENS